MTRGKTNSYHFFKYIYQYRSALIFRDYQRKFDKDALFIYFQLEKEYERKADNLAQECDLNDTSIY